MLWKPPISVENPPPTRRRWMGGFSLTEMVVTISIVGTLAGIAVSTFGGMTGAAKGALAEERREMLNAGVHRFAQYNYELVFSPQKASAGDEMLILRTLQYRNANETYAKVGSPYVVPQYNPVISSDPGDYRLMWNGRLYELLRPGDVGVGLKMVFDGSDLTEAFNFPPNFQMAGR